MLKIFSCENSLVQNYETANKQIQRLSAVGQGRLIAAVDLRG